MIKYSIVLPCYNEEENLPEIIQQFSEIINPENTEIILVDNGSTDGTEELLESKLVSLSFITKTKIKKNKGYGNGIMQGLKIAQGEFVGWTHADLQTDPADIVKAINIIEEEKTNNIFVKGERNGRSAFDRFFSRGMEFFVKVILKHKLYEINAQPNLFSRSLLDNIKNPPDHWGLDLYFYYHAEKLSYNFKRIPVSFPERKHGESKWNSGFLARVKFSIKMLNYCFEIRRDEKDK